MKKLLKALFILFLLTLVLGLGLFVYLFNSPYKYLYNKGYSIQDMLKIRESGLVNEMAELDSSDFLLYLFDNHPSDTKDFDYYYFSDQELKDKDFDFETLYKTINILKDNGSSKEEIKEHLLSDSITNKELELINNKKNYFIGYDYLKNASYSSNEIAKILTYINDKDIHYLDGIKHIDSLDDLIENKNFNFNLLPRYLIALRNEKAKLNNVIEYVNNNEDFVEVKDLNWSELYKNIKEVKEPTSYTALVNKENKLPEDYEPDDLEYLPVGYYGNNHPMRKVAKEALIKLIDDASALGYPGIVGLSNYRSYSTQSGLYNRYAANDGIFLADMYSARPGFSEHQTGLVSDMSYQGGGIGDFENFNGYSWVRKNAHKYGFILRFPLNKEYITGYEYESWHFRYVGEEVATIIYENDWTLEEFKELYD